MLKWILLDSLYESQGYKNRFVTEVHLVKKAKMASEFSVNHWLKQIG